MTVHVRLAGKWSAETEVYDLLHLQSGSMYLSMLLSQFQRRTGMDALHTRSWIRTRSDAVFGTNMIPTASPYGIIRPPYLQYLEMDSQRLTRSLGGS